MNTLQGKNDRKEHSMKLKEKTCSEVKEPRNENQTYGKKIIKRKEKRNQENDE